MLKDSLIDLRPICFHFSQNSFVLCKNTESQEFSVYHTKAEPCIWFEEIIDSRYPLTLLMIHEAKLLKESHFSGFERSGNTPLSILQDTIFYETKVDERVMVIPGTDGQKMSKSYYNFIDIFYCP